MTDLSLEYTLYALLVVILALTGGYVLHAAYGSTFLDDEDG